MSFRALFAPAPYRPPARRKRRNTRSEIWFPGARPSAILRAMPTDRQPFQRLLATAAEEVQHTLRALPRPVREKALAVPVVYERAPAPDVQSDDVPPDTLGLFVGETFRDAYAGAHDLPAQVILYLENIWDYAGHDLEFFREEVRRTLLHELGHYLGLDEDDLADRDLD